MKSSFTISILFASSMLGTVACDRFNLELSPEALVPYGVPSQKSNTPSTFLQKSQNSDNNPGSSAITSKPRAD